MGSAEEESIVCDREGDSGGDSGGVIATRRGRRQNDGRFLCGVTGTNEARPGCDATPVDL